MRDNVHQIFQRSYRELRPRAPMPEFRVEFYAFANVNNTIRLREDVIHVRISDLLEGSPETVIEAIAHILLAKIYRKPIQPLHSTRYRRYVSSHDMTAKAHLLRQARGRKHISSARGFFYDLDQIFEDLNQRFFYGLLARPQMTWSRVRARNSLAHYDPAHNAIVVSRVFDHFQVPRYAVEYIVYHEMLHLKHPVKLRGSRRCVHGPEFQAEEKLFPKLEEAKLFLKRL
ncbi:MAG: SprT-like domain-containing protein [Candidatus Korobacteraceae bacterium]